MKWKLTLLTVIYFITFSFGQDTGLPLGNDAYHILDRLELKTGLIPEFHSGVKYYLRADAVDYALKINEAALPITAKDRRDIFYIFKDNNECLPKEPATAQSKVEQKVYTDSTNTFYTIESIDNPSSAEGLSPFYFESKKPFLKNLYKTPANMWEVNRSAFYLRVNPVLNLKMYGANEDGNSRLFMNQRGIDIRGGIDGKVFFQSSILESQARFADYVRNRIKKDKAVPGAGFYKFYNSGIFSGDGANDFLLAQGYIGFNISRHVSMQLGHGRNFIGNGYRSMFLSDFGNNYFYLKLNARVWKFHYQTIFTELNAAGVKDDIGDLLIPKKYAALHYLSFKANKNFSVGFFEAIVFNRNNHFEFQYLNPVIFYRTVEQAVGSSDNAFLGFDFKWNAFKKFQFYGQLLLDEFKFNELVTDRNGWWGNKNSVQLGVKYIDMFGVDHLDGQVEFNMSRPYTYTHRDSSASYTHYNQPLAHPLGANFKEFVFRLRYQAGKKLLIQPRLIYAQTGEDPVGENWGSDLLIPHTTREMNYGNSIGQGIDTKILIGAIDLSYQLKHNLFIDINYLYRNKNSAEDTLDLTTSYFGGGIRLNFANRNLDF